MEPVANKDAQSAAERLNDILFEMQDLLSEASRLVRVGAGKKRRDVVDRADAYWLAHIADSLGGPRDKDCTLWGTIEELRAIASGRDSDDDEGGA